MLFRSDRQFHRILTTRLGAIFFQAVRVTLHIFELQRIGGDFRRCNFFNGIDNLFDESHVAYTHQYYFRKILEIPNISYQRIPEGAVLFSSRPGKGTRSRQFLLPNVLRLKVPAGDDPEIDWATYVNWRVPIDNHTHDTFGVRYIEAEGPVRERYLARRAKADALPVPPVEDLAERILRGEATLESVKAELREQVKQDVLAQAHNERWGDAGAMPDWLRRIHLEGDVRVRFQKIGRAHV